MKKIIGVFEWKDRQLIFRTQHQQYHVDEYHLLHRLAQRGVNRNSPPRQVTLMNAVWMVNQINGLRIVYMQKVSIH